MIANFKEFKKKVLEEYVEYSSKKTFPFYFEGGGGLSAVMSRMAPLPVQDQARKMHTHGKVSGP